MSVSKRWIPLLVIFLIPAAASGQQADLIWNPQLSYSWQSSDQLSFSAKVSAFNSVRDFDNDSAIRYIEPKFIFSYRLPGSASVGGGYYYRWSFPLQDSDAYEHRFLQQVGFKFLIGDMDISNRFRIEQRVRSSSYQNRIRYRLSHKFPIQNEPGRTDRYVVLSDEVMTAFNRDAADAENRVALGLGWIFNDKKVFETGIQYRTQGIFSENGISHMLLLFTTFSFN